MGRCRSGTGCAEEKPLLGLVGEAIGVVDLLLCDRFGLLGFSIGFVE